MPIMIIPIHAETKVDCLTQNGKTYCEKEIRTPEQKKYDNKIMGFGILGFVIYFTIFAYMIENDFNGWIIGLFATSPFILLGLAFIFG